jgi:hypothetical protein
MRIRHFLGKVKRNDTPTFGSSFEAIKAHTSAPFGQPGRPRELALSI